MTLPRLGAPTISRAGRDAAAVLIVASSGDAAWRYRCGHPAEQLRACGVSADVISILDSKVVDRVRGARVVIFHRVGLDRYIERVYRRVQADRGIVVFDTDDLVFDAAARLAVPHRLYGMDPVRAAWLREDAEAQRRAMGRADAILVATGYLAEEARDIGTPTWVHRNGFSLEMLQVSEEARAGVGRAAETREREGTGRRGRIVIGYASGTPTHDGDFRVAKPALLRILQAHEDAELWLVGPVEPGDGWGTARDRVRRIPLVSWKRLPFVLARFDVAIAPLETEKRFCRAKSEVKYVESGLVRVPTMASAGAGFDQAIHSGENGLLAFSTEDWVEQLEMLIGDPERRRRMGDRAHADVLERYHPAVRGKELLAILNEVSRTVRGYPLWPEGGQSPALGRPLTPFRRESGKAGMLALPVRRALYSLRHRGLRIFLMELWIHARGWWRGLLQLSARS